jgi:hypothetical protein
MYIISLIVAMRHNDVNVPMYVSLGMESQQTVMEAYYCECLRCKHVVSGLIRYGRFFSAPNQATPLPTIA